MWITVVVPAYNPNIWLLQENIANILYNSNSSLKEILLIDDGSYEKISSDIFLKYWDKVRIIHQKNTWVWWARNTWIQESKTDIIAFIDSDCVADHNRISRIGQNIVNWKYIWQWWKVLTYQNDNVISNYAEAKWLLQQPKIQNWWKMLCVITANCAFLKDTLLEVNWFHEWKTSDGSFITEDLDLTYKLENAWYIWWLWYAEDALVYHSHRSTLADLLKQHYYYWYGSVYHCLLRNREFQDLNMCEPNLLNSIKEIPQHIKKAGRLMIKDHTKKYWLFSSHVLFPSIDIIRRMAVQYWRYSRYTQKI